MKVTEEEDELVLLSGITTLISLVWLTEYIGISVLAGIYASGLILSNTELGFRVRERFSAVKDFFTAVSFISIGYLLSLPSAEYLGMALILVLFSSVLKPLIVSQVLRLQGYDLRTGFMAGIQSAQISEIVVLASLLFSPITRNTVFETVSIAFALTVLIAHLVEDREQWLFEKLFSEYELDSEKTYIPEKLEDHVIISGYDWKTQGLEKIVDGQVVVADYSLERVEDAEENALPHLLADLRSDEAWEELNAGEATVIVSAIRDSSLIEKIRDMDVDAEKILIESGSDDVQKQLREMLRESLK